MFKIQIPKPCHEEWSAMTPTQQGAFCSSCNREVVDFTKMTDEEVQNYFLHKATSKTCGHFRVEQVQCIRITLPENLLLKRIAGWKKFMVIVLLAFGSMLFGCDVQTNKDDLLTGITVSTHQKQQAHTGDTVLPKQILDTSTCSSNSITLGTPAIILGEPATTTEVPTVDGDIELVPIDSIKTVDIPDYNSVFTGRILLEKKHDTTTKKPASDTTKCKDTGFFN